MADTVDESAFWLPSEFLTDDDLLMASTHNPPQSHPALQPSNPLFRRSSSALNSPGESIESSESSDDPDEFIAELTRHLAQSGRLHPQEKKPCWGALAISPQSTLAGFPTTRPSPAFAHAHAHDDALELIYAAAAERLAHMRLTSQAQMLERQHSIRRELLRSSSARMASQCTPPVRFNAPQNNQFQQMKMQAKQAWLAQQQAANRGANAGVHGLPPPLRAQQHHHHLSHHGCGGAGAGMRAVFLGGSAQTGVKRQSTGTGVFLPRRTGNNAPTEPRKKQGCSTVLLPARVVQALNLNIDEMNGHTHPPHSHAQTQPCLSPSNHEILMARRNAVFAQQQRRGGLRVEGPMSHRNHEAPLLPQEWTY